MIDDCWAMTNSNYSVFSLSVFFVLFCLGNEKNECTKMSTAEDLGVRFKLKYKPVCGQTFFSVLGNSVIKGPYTIHLL